MRTGVVLHLTQASPDKHRAVLRGAVNLLPEVAPGTPIEIVVHAEAIAVARLGRVTADALAEALDSGSTLVVCRNSKRSHQLTDDDLVPGAVVVPSGVGHLVARQGQGSAYLRPGRAPHGVPHVRLTAFADAVRTRAPMPACGAAGS